MEQRKSCFKIKKKVTFETPLVDDNYTACPRHLQMTYVLVYGVGGCGVVWSTHTMRSGFDDKYLKYRQNEIEKLCIAETVKETRARQK
jgi:hypothetical protein